MLDEHQYAEAIVILEEEYSKSPQNKVIATLLAQAHLGSAGIELFDFIFQVFGEQGPQESLDLVFDPDCDNAAIERVQGFDFRCLAERILRRLPEDPDNPHFERARNLLRITFPSPIESSNDVNFLMAFVELGSAFSRLKVLLKRSLLVDIKAKATLTPADLPFDFMIRNTKRFFNEIMSGITRTKYSYGKINKYVIQNEGKPIIKIGEGSLTFSENLSVSDVTHFAINVIHEESYKVDHELNKVVSKNVNNFGVGILRVLRTMDAVHFGGDGLDTVEVMWSFERAINRVLTQFADTPDKQNSNFDVFDIVWKNPPVILRDLISSARKSWDEEKSEPLKNYFIQSKEQWNELNRLLFDWQEWVNEKISKDQREQIIEYLNDLQKREPETFSLPVNLTTERIQVWQHNLVKKLDEEMNQILNGNIPKIPRLSEENVKNGFMLIQKSKNWIENNLWPISEPVASKILK